MDHKIGVFICTGYGIKDALDLDALAKVATEEFSVEFVKQVPGCEGAELEDIFNIVEDESITKALIAGISPRCYSPQAFPDSVIVECVPIREFVIWCQPPNEEDTQMLAEDYLRMGLTKLGKTEPLVPFKPEEEINKSILVVGGGIAGMTAAIEAAKAGSDVKLVEKTDKLGGWLGKQHKSIPTKAPYHELEDTGIDALTKEIKASKNITLYTSATTGKIEGGPGLYDVTLHSTNGSAGQVVDTFRVGAIIQATGWKPEAPEEVTHLGYGQFPDVIRNFELEEMVKRDGKITRPSNGKEAKSVAFIQWSGTPREDQFSYCSAIIDLTSLKQALYLRELNSHAAAYIFYDFFRTPGQYEEFYRTAQEDPGVFMSKGDVTAVEAGDNGQLVLSAKNTMLGPDIQVEVDLVVLATGMIPNATHNEKLRQLTDAKTAAEFGDTEPIRKAGAKKAEALKEHEGSAILNLNYRQGTDLPILENNFPDSHFICFPYETRRTGIYAAGCMRTPMDGVEAREDGLGAALKAIQCIEMTSRGEAMHPRAGDQSFPNFFMQKCTSCKRCTEECPFGTLNEDEKGTPQQWLTRCRRCGICMGACPERIISFNNYSVSQIGDMIKAVEVPDEWDEKPRILALLCENDAIPALELAAQHRLQYSPFIRVFPVRCLGSLNIVWISEALAAGYDGVIMMGCPFGEDYQCHFIKGSELAETRGGNVKEKLQQMSMENERAELHQIQISDYEKIPQIFNDFAELIEEIGMNPFKGM